VLPLGVWLLLNTPAAAVTPLLCAFVAIYGSYRLFGDRGGQRGDRSLGPAPGSAVQAIAPRGDRWGEIVVGAAGGLSGGVAAAPGIFPAIWCNLCGWDKVRTRSGMQPYILAMQLMTLYWMHGTSAAPR